MWFSILCKALWEGINKAEAVAGEVNLHCKVKEMESVAGGKCISAESGVYR